MKKLIAGLAVAMAVSVVNAASINWTVTGSVTAVVNDYQGSPYAGTVYLVKAADLSSITFADTEQNKADFTTALNALTITTTTPGVDGKKPSVSKQVVTDNALTAGTVFSFGLLIVSEDAQGVGYYKVLKANGTPYVTGADAWAQTTLTTPWNTLGTQSWVKAYAVPEPATGALALAGLALLFRRRRA